VRAGQQQVKLPLAMKLMENIEGKKALGKFIKMNPDTESEKERGCKRCGEEGVTLDNGPVGSWGLIGLYHMCAHASQKDTQFIIKYLAYFLAELLHITIAFPVSLTADSCRPASRPKVETLSSSQRMP